MLRLTLGIRLLRLIEVDVRGNVRPTKERPRQQEIRACAQYV